MAVRLCLFAVGPDHQVLHLSYARVRRIQLGTEPFHAADGSLCLVAALIDLDGAPPRILKQVFIKCGVDAKGYLKPTPDGLPPIPPNIGSRDAEKFFDAFRRLPDRWTPTKEHLLQLQLRAKRCTSQRAAGRRSRASSLKK